MVAFDQSFHQLRILASLEAAWIIVLTGCQQNGSVNTLQL